ncbi:MAG TPA: hypothetical protein VKX16_19760 [Chloroflexota bacterium]|nr:hypothetical protein [Chloroflexota bacterium]
MKTAVRLIVPALLALAGLNLFTGNALAAFNNFQGFETDTGDWVASQAITRVPSGGGALHLTASSGNYYAELQNLHDGYQLGYGDGGYSFFGGADSVYHGPFYQAIDVYIDANWAPAAASYAPSFWIDETPYHADPNNYGAEHNFRLTATGSSVNVTVDGQTTPMATLTTSGWYTFVMTWRQDVNLANPAITDLSIYDSNHQQVGTTDTVYATSPGGPFASSDLRGNGYVWITLWQNGFANDVLGLDNVRTGPVAGMFPPTSKDQCKNGGWQNFNNPTFKNQGDCVSYVASGGKH